ncbi:AraC family transcriptional regulator [Pseudomonas sp. F1_0610]|uniref:AraC family transcriptional regulator n=1 Tax=Pseudomonas sp. F1_0610 TaxID=3114284 RepID=UPI0039C0F962
MYQEKRYIAYHYWLTCKTAAEKLGVSGAELLQKSNVDISLLTEPRLITPSELHRLIHQLWAVNQDEFMGMAEGFCQQGQFALMLEYAASAQSLGAMLKRSCKYYAINQPMVQVTLAALPQDRIKLTLDLRNKNYDFAHMLQEFLMLSWLRCSSWLVGQQLPIQQSCFAYAKPAHAQEYSKMFAGELVFKQKECAFIFNANCLQWPLVRSAEEVKKFLGHMPAEIFHYVVADESISAQLRLLLHKYDYAEFPDLTALADLLFISPRTLRRRLQAENTSLRAIKDKLKQELAYNLLTDEHVSISYVASRLGFSEVAAFCRAFKRWTGHAPTHWQVNLTEN